MNEFVPTNHKSARVCVIGLGNVGLPTAHCIHKRGYSVYGYDVDSARATNTQRDKMPLCVKGFH